MGLSKTDSAYILRWAKRIKAINLLGGKCKKCGDSNIFHLVFHHPFGEEKEKSICQIRTKRWSVIREEVKKCELLCRNCHIELHYHGQGKNLQRSQLKKKLLEIKGIFECVQCGYSGEHYSSLNFHHLKDKSFEISDEFGRSNFTVTDKILDEIKKCEIVCSNCHGVSHTDIDKFDNLKNHIYNKVNDYKEHNAINKELVLSMYNNGIRQIDIAKKFNCAKSTICYLIKKYK